MCDNTVKYKSGIISGMVEVIVTHPIDFYKTQKQYQSFQNIPVKFRARDMYNGILSRFFGIVPMRLLFWCSQDYGEIIFKKYGKYKFALAGSMAGSIQTFLDYPVEQIKIRRIINQDSYYKIFNDIKNSHNILQGFSFTLFRNVGFAALFNHLLKSNYNSEKSVNYNFALAASSGFISSVVTQPFDYFKTVYQSNKDKSLFLKDIYNETKRINILGWNYLIFFRGGLSRASISFLSMGIGFTIYENCKNYLKEIED